MNLFGYFLFSLLVVVLLNRGLFREAAHQNRNPFTMQATPWSNLASATGKEAGNIYEIMNDLMDFPELKTIDVFIPELDPVFNLDKDLVGPDYRLDDKLKELFKGRNMYEYIKKPGGSISPRPS